MNNLKSWNRAFSINSSLRVIDVRGNQDWVLDEQLLQLSSLEIITGVTWSDHCVECTLERKSAIGNVFNAPATKLKWQVPIYCVTLDTTVPTFSQLLNRLRFKTTACRDVNRCRNAEATVREFSDSMCWLVSRRLMVLHCTFGVLSILLNTIVVLTFVTSKSLWRSISLTFATNMAFSDSLTGIYGVLIASVLLYYGNTTMLHRRYDICPKIGIFWMMGQSGTIITSVLLTIDRYLTIVHSLKPELRITSRLVKASLLMCWSVTLLVTIYPQSKGFYGLTSSCVPLTVRQGSGVKLYTLGVSITALLLYLSTIPMYGHIYYVIKRSSQEMGIKREAKVMRKITTLVGTNFMFFFLPTACLGLITLFTPKVKEGTSALVQNLHFWLPSLSVGLNSCINPILYSYRNEKFRQELKTKFQFWNWENPKVCPQTALYKNKQINK